MLHRFFLPAPSFPPSLCLLFYLAVSRAYVQVRTFCFTKTDHLWDVLIGGRDCRRSCFCHGSRARFVDVPIREGPNGKWHNTPCFSWVVSR